MVMAVIQKKDGTSTVIVKEELTTPGFKEAIAQNPSPTSNSTTLI